MDQVQVLECIKSDVRAINDALNRAMEKATDKTNQLSDKVREDLLEMQVASENLRIAAEQFEHGAANIGRPLPEKVA